MHNPVTQHCLYCFGSLLFQFDKCAKFDNMCDSIKNDNC